MKVTPDQIRAERRELTFTAEECSVVADALELADAGARAFVECHCRSCGGSAAAGWQRDTRTASDEDAPAVAQALHYLESRGLLRRSRTDPHVVSFSEFPEPA